MIPEVQGALVKLREERGRIDVAIVALEALGMPAAPASAPVTKKAPAVKPASAPKAKAETPRAKPGMAPKYDEAVLDVLHLSGDAGIRCAQIARRIAKPGTPETEVQRLVSTIWNVLKKFEAAGKATVTGGVWRLAAVIAVLLAMLMPAPAQAEPLAPRCSVDVPYWPAACYAHHFDPHVYFVAPLPPADLVPAGQLLDDELEPLRLTTAPAASFVAFSSFAPESAPASVPEPVGLLLLGTVVWLGKRVRR